MVELTIKLVLLLSGAWFVALLDEALLRRSVDDSLRGGARSHFALAPLYRGAALWLQQTNRTEAPDWLNWRLAPALYLALAVAAMTLVPLAPGQGAVADPKAGIVIWGAIETLTVVVVFLHGWSTNSLLPLIGAYRYVAIGLSAMLLSMFVLIAAALPAESLNITAIVESQQTLWNVVRQPLGLPLFLVLGLSLALRGPLDYADAGDLAGGTSAEDSGVLRLTWQVARLVMLVSFAAMASSVFLGGYLGPVLPPPLWLAVKTAAVLALLVYLGHLFPRLPPARMLTFVWMVLMPLSFVGLVLAGLEALP